MDNFGDSLKAWLALQVLLIEPAEPLSSLEMILLFSGVLNSPSWLEAQPFPAEKCISNGSVPECAICQKVVYLNWGVDRKGRKGTLFKCLVVLALEH